MKENKILITGVAGFIGFHLAKKLLNEGHQVFGIDNLNDYYDVNLKKSRLVELNKNSNFQFRKIDISHEKSLLSLFQNHQFDIVFHLAAQAGVRYSIENPHLYIKSNINGFMNILESCRKYSVKHLFYASSSSVYGNYEKVPYSVDDPCNEPVSLYAATKKANELMAFSYGELHHLNTTGLRFFTVYGPWGRPDMAYFSFTDKILKRKQIELFNNGDMLRDFTYIDDVVISITKVYEVLSKNRFIWNSEQRSKILNIGNSNPERLMDLVKNLEFELGIEAKKKNVIMQKGDVYKTFADIRPLVELISYSPKVSLKEGIRDFIAWYKEYYNIK